MLQSGLVNNLEKKQANAVYEESTGVLTIKDVSVAGQHYYVELIDQEEYQFAIQHLQLLSESASDTPASVAGNKVRIPEVFAFGNYYTVELLSKGNTFGLSKVTARVER